MYYLIRESISFLKVFLRLRADQRQAVSTDAALADEGAEEL